MGDGQQPWLGRVGAVSRRIVQRHLFVPTLALVLVTLAGAGCAAFAPSPDLRVLYERSARLHGPERNPVIVIPGLLGTRLLEEETEVEVWGAFRGKYADPRSPEGARSFSLPMQEGATLAELRDRAYPDSVLETLRVRLLGVPFQLKAYRNILQLLGTAGYRDETVGLSGLDYGDDHFTCFQFPYDWRRDNVENARRLADFIEEKRAQVRAEIRKRYGVDRPDLRFDLVAHSMGSVLTRYYLRYGGAELPADGSPPEVTWAGAANVSKVILVAPPNSGTLSAFMQLVDGRKFGPTLPRYSAAVLGTLPSGYQLLPHGAEPAVVWADAPSESVGDLFDPELWQRMGWGLASEDETKELGRLLPNARDPEERRRIALDHQRKALQRARQFTQALDRRVPAPEGLDMYLVIGDAVPTVSRVGVDRKTGAVRVLERAPGDGTVLRNSALADQRTRALWTPEVISPIDWRDAFFVSAGHVDMTRDPAFTDNLLYRLLEAPRE